MISVLSVFTSRFTLYNAIRLSFSKYRNYRQYKEYACKYSYFTSVTLSIKRNKV
nr:MAG TPA: hypothetical protein [Caudoviricetes sp.]